MEPTEFIRENLNWITPAVLRGHVKLTPAFKREIINKLQKKAVACFAIGQLKQAKEIAAFIESNSKFIIWPKNGVLYMMQNHNNYEIESSVIIYPTTDCSGMAELEKAIETIKHRQQ